MLKLILGASWKKNTDTLMHLLADDVFHQRGGRILMVPESVSHDAERRLCACAGDTASRFAEVLSFTRLAGRVRDRAGYGTYECMDAGGRVVAMASAAVQLHSKLKAYAAVETKPEFLIGLIEALDEFKCCCIRPDDLRLASKNTEGSLAQKLEELALLFDAYESLCQRGKRDPRDQMTWLLEQLEDSDFASDHVFYLDGFTDFTGQQMAILRHLLTFSPQVVVALCCEEAGSAAPAFQKAADTAQQLIRFAKQLDMDVQVEYVPKTDSPLQHVCDSLFHGTVAENGHLKDHLTVSQFEGVTDECEAAADRIMELVQSGYRFRDIRVVCTDMTVYADALRMAFSRRGIPVYISGTHDVLDMPVINTVLTALEAAIGGFEQRAVIRYLRSALSPIDLDTCDELENYAIMWNISGSRWTNQWKNDPEGLTERMEERSAIKLQKLNAERETALAPMIRLAEKFSEATLLSDKILAVYGFLEDIALASRLEKMAELAGSDGEQAQVQILNQLWEILITALEQLYDVLGHSAWDPEVFIRLLKLLLSQYDVGTIPPVLDAVTVGAISAMRCQQEEHLFVLGALEGCLPSYSSTGGVLTDQERNALRQLGVPLTGGSLDGLQSEFADIYNVFAGAQKRIYISCPSGQTSFVYRRLCALTGGLTQADNPLGSALWNTADAGSYLVRTATQKDADMLGLTDAYQAMASCVEHKLGKVSGDGIQALYGKKLNLSASQVDKLADCRLAYFLKYGLRAQERKEATVDPAEFGTYVHAVLEMTARRVMEMGGFHQVSLDDTLKLANEYSEEYAQRRFSQIDSERLSYLFRRNAQELQMIVTELWEELKDSQFLPLDFELAFGDDGKMEAITLPGAQIPAQLRGFVDRVDVWNDGNRNYFRVVDYKTGKKDFDYCDVFNGLGLQMLLYLFALEDKGKEILGDRPIPAGVQYFPARSPLIAADGAMTQEEVKEARQKYWKRKGLILNDDRVFKAMEATEEPVRLSYSRKKDGTVSGDIADSGQMKLLKAYIFTLLRKMVDDIASGCVEPNPYTRGSSHNACAFCPYGSVCHPQQLAGRRDYKAMTAQRFWEEIGKEMDRNG